MWQTPGRLGTIMEHEDHDSSDPPADKNGKPENDIAEELRTSSIY